MIAKHDIGASPLTSLERVSRDLTTVEVTTEERATILSATTEVTAAMIRSAISDYKFERLKLDQE